MCVIGVFARVRVRVCHACGAFVLFVPICLSTNRKILEIKRSQVCYWWARRAHVRVSVAHSCAWHICACVNMWVGGGWVGELISLSKQKTQDNMISFSNSWRMPQMGSLLYQSILEEAFSILCQNLHRKVRVCGGACGCGA